MVCSGWRSSYGVRPAGEYTHVSLALRRLHQPVEGVLGVRELVVWPAQVRHHEVQQPLGQPRAHVHARRQVPLLRRVDAHGEGEAAAPLRLAGVVEQAAHVADEPGQDGDVPARLRRLEEDAQVAVLQAVVQLDPVRPVVEDDLLQHVQPLLPNLRPGVVRARGDLRLVRILLADHHLRVVPLQPAEPVELVRLQVRRVVELQAAQHLQALLVRPVDHHPERVDALPQRVLQVLARPPPHDAVVVPLHPLAPPQPGLRVVPEGLPRRQADGQRVHARAQHLVHRLPEPVAAHRRVEPVHQVVPQVVVVHQLRLAHGGPPPSYPDRPRWYPMHGRLAIGRMVALQSDAQSACNQTHG